MTRATTSMIAVALAAVALLPGCRNDEQDRPLHFEKGKYEGTKDQALTPGQLKALRERAESMR